MAKEQLSFLMSQRLHNLCALAFLLTATYGFSLPAFEGSWTINTEETAALREPYKDNSRKRSSAFKPQISVGGLPMPGSSGQRAMSPLTARPPMVLRTNSMVIQFQNDLVKIEYPEIGEERLHKGEYRGRKTKWSTKQIKQTYKTTERRVTKTWSINAQGRLLVVVKIKPNEAKQVVTKMVFDRDSN